MPNSMVVLSFGSTVYSVCMSNFKKQISELQNNKKAFAFVAFIALCATALVLWALISFGVSLHQKRDLLRHGIQTSATVTRHTSQFEAVRGGGFDIYQISYAFTAGTPGKTVKNSAEIDYQDWKDLTVGSAIDVTYLADNATTNQPTVAVGKLNPSTRLVIYAVIGFMLIFILIPLPTKLIKLKKDGSLSFVVFIVTILLSFFIAKLLERGLAHVLASWFLQ